MTNKAFWQTTRQTLKPNCPDIQKIRKVVILTMGTSHNEYVQLPLHNMLIVSHEVIELNKAGILATRRAENGRMEKGARSFSFSNVIKDAQESPLLRRNLLQDHG